jgi:hypothetical protein
VLQLLDLAKENAALKRELRRLHGELAAFERMLARVLEIVAETDPPATDPGSDR